MIVTPRALGARRRVVLWRVRLVLWLAAAAAGSGIGTAASADLAAQVAAAIAGVVAACLAEAAFCYHTVPASGNAAGTPADKAALRARAASHNARAAMRETAAVPSPGGWAAPSGTLPAWNWPPPNGAAPRVERCPAWVRLWYRTPFIDRYAYDWMWHHGGWDVLPPAAG